MKKIFCATALFAFGTSMLPAIVTPAAAQDRMERHVMHRHMEHRMMHRHMRHAMHRRMLHNL